jgi:hypothetical protein
VTPLLFHKDGSNPRRVLRPVNAVALDHTATFRNPGSSGRESAPSDFGEKLEPTHVGCYGSGFKARNSTASRCVCCRSRLSTTSGVLPDLRHHCS